VVDRGAPSTNGDNGHGRDRRGRFVAGNPGGPGNPHVRTVAACRREFFKTVTPADVRKVIRTVVRLAVAGEPWAVRELLNRCLGKPSDTHQMHLHVEQEGDLGRGEALLKVIESRHAPAREPPK